MFLKISQNSQENTCVGISFFDKFADLRPATLLKERLQHRCFPVNFVKFLRAPFFYRTSPVAASGTLHTIKSMVYEKLQVKTR